MQNQKMGWGEVGWGSHYRITNVNTGDTGLETGRYLKSNDLAKKVPTKIYLKLYFIFDFKFYIRIFAVSAFLTYQAS